MTSSLRRSVAESRKNVKLLRLIRTTVRGGGSDDETVTGWQTGRPKPLNRSLQGSTAETHFKCGSDRRKGDKAPVGEAELTDDRGSKAGDRFASRGRQKPWLRPGLNVVHTPLQSEFQRHRSPRCPANLDYPLSTKAKGDRNDDLTDQN